MLRLFLIIAAVFFAVPVAAATPRAPLFDEVVKCRGIDAVADRAACYDRAVDALDAAERRRDIAVIDAGQVRETRRRLFGLALPDLPIFGDRGPNAPEISQIEGIVAAAEVDRYGHWLLTLADGGRWRQMDDNAIARAPRSGDAVVIKRGTLGSFKLSVRGQPSIRVRRELTSG